jgi:methylmalonyl-CoA/ethylmalonyl-CoA epimerase
MAGRPLLDHIGIAVGSLSESRRFYESLGLAVSDEQEVPEQSVRVAFLPVGDARIELLEPTAEASPIARHLARRGPGLHHLCLRVPDIRAAMAQLVREGYELLTEEPQPGAHGCLVCFVHPRSSGGVLIELSKPPGSVGS